MGSYIGPAPMNPEKVCDHPDPRIKKYVEKRIAGTTTVAARYVVLWAGKHVMALYEKGESFYDGAFNPSAYDPPSLEVVEFEKNLSSPSSLDPNVIKKTFEGGDGKRLKKSDKVACVEEAKKIDAQYAELVLEKNNKTREKKARAKAISDKTRAWVEDFAHDIGMKTEPHEYTDNRGETISWKASEEKHEVLVTVPANEILMTKSIRLEIKLTKPVDKPGHVDVVARATDDAVYDDQNEVSVRLSDDVTPDKLRAWLLAFGVPLGKWPGTRRFGRKGAPYA